MKRMKHLITMLGCVALFGNATVAHAEKMPATAENDGRIFSINFIGERSSSVTLHYKAAEKNDGTRSAMILIETLKRKLAEKGFELRHSEDSWQDAVHGYSVFIIDDTGYSGKTHALEKREGHLIAIILENEKVAAVNTAPAKENELEYRQIENMADEIVARLLFHSYI